jgi:hypothetical protein
MVWSLPVPFALGGPCLRARSSGCVSRDSLCAAAAAGFTRRLACVVCWCCCSGPPTRGTCPLVALAVYNIAGYCLGLLWVDCWPLCRVFLNHVASIFLPLAAPTHHPLGVWGVGVRSRTRAYTQLLLCSQLAGGVLSCRPSNL